MLRSKSRSKFRLWFRPSGSWENFHCLPDSSRWGWSRTEPCRVQQVVTAGGALPRPAGWQPASLCQGQWARHCRLPGTCYPLGVSGRYWDRLGPAFLLIILFVGFDWNPWQTAEIDKNPKEEAACLTWTHDRVTPFLYSDRLCNCCVIYDSICLSAGFSCSMTKPLLLTISEMCQSASFYSRRSSRSVTLFPVFSQSSNQFFHYTQPLCQMCPMSDFAVLFLRLTSDRSPPPGADLPVSPLPW